MAFEKNEYYHGKRKSEPGSARPGENKTAGANYKGGEVRARFPCAFCVDEECKKQLEAWQEKAKTSKFYENAIQTWTVRDVEKQRIAKENNLNYKVIY